MLIFGIAQQAKSRSISFNSERDIDSLRAELQYIDEDSDKVQLLFTISFKYLNLDSEKGIEYGIKALDLANNLSVDKNLKAAILNNLGSLYSKQQNYSDALEYFHKALELERNIGNKESIAQILTELGDVYLHIVQDTNVTYLLDYPPYISSNNNKNLNKSIEHSLEAVSIYEIFLSSVKAHESYHNLYLAYELKGEYKSALLYCKKFERAAHRSLFQYYEYELISLEKKLRNKEQEKARVRLAEQNTREHLILYFSIVIIVLIVVVIFLTYRLKRLSSKIIK